MLRAVRVSYSKACRKSKHVPVGSDRFPPRSSALIVPNVRRFSSNEEPEDDVTGESPKGDQWKTFGDIGHYTPAKYVIKTFNKISPLGLARFPTEHFVVRADECKNAHAILLRSHKLQESEVPPTVHAIARYVFQLSG